MAKRKVTYNSWVRNENKGSGRGKKRKTVGTFTVEEIVDVRFDSAGKPEYFVHWEGFSPSMNTWEPEEHIEDESLINNFYKKRNINAEDGHVSGKKHVPRKQVPPARVDQQNNNLMKENHEDVANSGVSHEEELGTAQPSSAELVSNTIENETQPSQVTPSSSSRKRKTAKQVPFRTRTQPERTSKQKTHTATSSPIQRSSQKRTLIIPARYRDRENEEDLNAASTSRRTLPASRGRPKRGRPSTTSSTQEDLPRSNEQSTRTHESTLVGFDRSNHTINTGTHINKIQSPQSVELGSEIKDLKKVIKRVGVTMDFMKEDLVTVKDDLNNLKDGVKSLIEMVKEGFVQLEKRVENILGGDVPSTSPLKSPLSSASLLPRDHASSSSEGRSILGGNVAGSSMALSSQKSLPLSSSHLSPPHKELGKKVIVNDLSEEEDNSTGHSNGTDPIPSSRNGNEMATAFNGNRSAASSSNKRSSDDEDKRLLIDEQDEDNPPSHSSNST